MLGDGSNPYKGNTIKCKRDENIDTDSPLIMGLLKDAHKFETERYRLTRTHYVKGVKMGEFAIYDKLCEKIYYLIRKDIKILTDEGNDGRYLISSPNPRSAMQVDKELEGFLRRVAKKLKLELRTERMVTHRAYQSPMGINCIFRKKTEDRFLPSLTREELEKIDVRIKEYQSDFNRFVPEWQAYVWAWDDALGLRINCEEGVLLFNYLVDRVGYITNEDKVMWTVDTTKYDIVIRNFEQYRHNTCLLQEESFWKK